MTPEILSVTEQKVPSVIGLSGEAILVIGNKARELGLRGRTNTYHFKPELGKVQDDSKYEARIDKAGRQFRAKPKPYWVRKPETKETETFSPLEATHTFLENLIPKENGNPAQIILGEPSLDEKWRRNYRKNMKQVVANLGFNEPVFFPEPFAVYQYYRHVEGLIQNTQEQQTVLVVDFGGGTFDCCVIQTTKSGELARSGANSLPLGVQSVDVAGEAVDFGLLKKSQDIAKEAGVTFKDDPIGRARKSAQSLWIAENAKIRLSDAIKKYYLGDEKKLNGIVESIKLPAGSFHMDQDVEVKIHGGHLRDVVKSLWDRQWGKVIIDCHNHAEKKLGSTIENYDIVLLAGGSAQLPFIENLILGTLPNQLKGTNIVTGSYAGAAVAKGIAIECREQADKRPTLVNNRLVSCLLNDLYIRCGYKKNDNKSVVSIPKVTHSDSVEPNREGLVYQSPGPLEDNLIKCKLELRKKKPNGVLYFWFHSSSTGHEDPLNIVSQSVRIPGGIPVDKKIDLELKIEADGMVTPQFTFTRHGKEPALIPGQPFNLGANRVEGKVFLGVDFGTCNSYIARFIVPQKEQKSDSYPKYEVNRDVTARLLKLENRCHELRKSGVLSKENLINHAKKNELDFIFHSNKIEGNKLSRGETKGALLAPDLKKISKDEKEAKNLETAYRWVLDTHQSSIDNCTAFVREINKKLLTGIESNLGNFRTEDVTISGVNYSPPHFSSVDDLMHQLNKEVRQTHGCTSGLELAVRVHTKLVAIHPFIDGNGRTARLLIAAILLNYELPIIVLNADDKGRYLSALQHSNDGSLDSLLTFFIEIMKQTLSDLEDAFQDEIKGGVVGSAISKKLDLPKKAVTIQDETKSNPSKIKRETPAVKNVKKSKLSKIPGRLRSILKKKSEVRKKAQKITYSAWKSAFEMFRNELSSYVAELDEMEDFRDAGYELRFDDFDIVTEQNFEAFWTRRDLSHTWFCSITISNGIESHGIMFQFGRCSNKLRTLKPNTAPVTCTLAIGGQRTGSWFPVGEEPILLREIGYVNGEVIYMDFDGNFIKGGLNDILNDLVADLLEEEL